VAEGEGTPRKPKAIKKYRLVQDVIVRSGFDRDSELVTTLKEGREVKVFEERANNDGILRVRSKHGWMSVQSKSGNLLMQEVVRASTGSKKKKSKQRSTPSATDSGGPEEGEDDDGSGVWETASTASSRSSHSSRASSGRRRHAETPRKKDHSKYMELAILSDDELRRREHHITSALREVKAADQQYTAMRKAADGVVAAFIGTVQPNQNIAEALVGTVVDTDPAADRMMEAYDSWGTHTQEYADSIQRNVIAVADEAVQRIAVLVRDTHASYKSARDEYDGALGYEQHLKQAHLLVSSDDSHAQLQAQEAAEAVAEAKVRYRQEERRFLTEMVEILVAREQHEATFVATIINGAAHRAQQLSNTLQAATDEVESD
jgi:uncharacterized protein YpmB